MSSLPVSSGEWRLHPQAVQIIWRVFGPAEVNLYISEEKSHCPVFFSKEKDMVAHEWPSLSSPAQQNQSWMPEMVQLLLAAPWMILLRQALLSQIVCQTAKLLKSRDFGAPNR
ncbi:hypothetical protein DPX16_2536 [Anabarilius grahami]|uniref:Uncharacterized protein n=1 Tax=Anabarilius grahami TaxID=495550 RepID=A0A3N0XGQ4_ANAGA|nr:hypothetical protein DPX16_2536 [Anabarilius grahami]